MQIKTEISNLINYRLYLTILQVVENYLKKQRYLRIELPVLSPALIPELNIKAFETEYKYIKKKQKLYLTPSPELFLKRLLAHNIGNCYYLGKSFRNNEQNSSLHSFEFTMLEFYKIGSNYMEMANEFLKMIQYISKIIFGKKVIEYNGKEIDLSKFEKISITQAFEKYAGIKEKELFNKSLFLKKAREKKYTVKGFSYEELFSQIYATEIEPNLGINGYPTLIYNYPKDFSSLSKLSSDKKTAERLEIYICGIELANCYTELNCWKEQQKRFKIRKASHSVDMGLIKALQYGLKNCAGIAVGMERLGMIFADVKSIHKLRLINIVNN